MPSYSKNDIILVRYPFTDLKNFKIRPAVVVSAPHVSHDLIVVPLTSRTSHLLSGEFMLTHWAEAGLNVPTVVKRGLFTVHQGLAIKAVGKLAQTDIEQLVRSLQ